MYSYILGEITEINDTHITIEAHGIGYLVKVPNPYNFKLHENYQVFIYHLIKESISEFYGFIKKEEKQIFEKLISVKGLGPKLALQILKSSSIDDIINAVNSLNPVFFTNFNGIGSKLSQQIIIDLKGKLNFDTTKDEKVNQLTKALINLGYTKNEINAVLKQVNLDKDTNVTTALKDALKLIKS